MSKLLLYVSKVRIRPRRRWNNCVFILFALGAGYFFLNPPDFSSTLGYNTVLDGVRVSHPWLTAVRGRVEGILPSRIPGAGFYSGNTAAKLPPPPPLRKHKSNRIAKPKVKASSARTRKGNKPERVVPLDQPRAFHSHKWRADGLLEVHPHGRHPIYDLIERAEKDWNDKLSRQSKSLDEAVSEYRRRYGRSPPAGFDRWWDYVEEHNVQLPDEYDLINEDLEPYWAVSPKDLHKLESGLEEYTDTWTMGKSGVHGMMVLNMSLQASSTEMHLAAAYELIDTLKPVQEHMPHFRAVVNPHDNPRFVSSHQFKTMAKAAVNAGKYLDLKNLNTESVGWVSGCSKSSPARTQPYDLERPPPPSPVKTFIHDHYAAMNPCLHPQILHHHGQFLSHEYGPGPVMPPPPHFSYSNSRLHFDIHLATPFNWVEDIPGDLPWEQKHDDRLMWRGRNTGIYHSKDMKYWRQSHRESMVAFADRMRGNVQILVGGDRDEGFRNKTVSVKHLNGAMLDLEFAEYPVSCDEDACQEMEKLYEYAEHMDWRAAGEYKYSMDIDGNGWSSRFKRLITTHALNFKATAYSEWFQDRIQPWVHYIPVQLDWSDLYDCLAFFRGDATGAGAHDDLAKKIATAGRRWSQEFWRTEDMTAYNYRLMLEYARLMSFDREAATYKDIDGDNNAW